MRTCLYQSDYFIREIHFMLFLHLSNVLFSSEETRDRPHVIIAVYPDSQILC